MTSDEHEIARLRRELAVARDIAAGRLDRLGVVTRERGEWKGRAISAQDRERAEFEMAERLRAELIERAEAETARRAVPVILLGVCPACGGDMRCDDDDCGSMECPSCMGCRS